MKKKIIIFDLDGTLYKLNGGTYNKSSLKKRVLINAQKFIINKLNTNKKKSTIILNEIQKKYKQEISIGLEKKYNINRYDYFNTVWNIPVRSIIKNTPNINPLLTNLSKKYVLILVSDAPRIWIENVLKELRIYNLFKKNIYSGDGNIRKGFDNSLKKIVDDYKINPIDCISIGDQEKTDIIPAKKLGMKTIYITKKLTNNYADYCINSITRLPNILLL